MSDGTSNLYYMTPDSLKLLNILRVTDNNGPVPNINELEYIKGEILANVWQTDRIVKIDPQGGRVTAWIDLTGLLSAQDRARGVDFLNGIAYDTVGDRLFVTGKLWPKLFEIKLRQRRLEIKR